LESVYDNPSVYALSDGLCPGPADGDVLVVEVGEGEVYELVEVIQHGGTLGGGGYDGQGCEGVGQARGTKPVVVVG
jgi:hypothetical protein